MAVDDVHSVVGTGLWSEIPASRRGATRADQPRQPGAGRFRTDAATEYSNLREG
jgi:hypothetical protein